MPKSVQSAVVGKLIPVVIKTFNRKVTGINMNKVIHIMNKKGRGFEVLSPQDFNKYSIQVSETIDPTIKGLHIELQSGRIILVTVKMMHDEDQVGLGTAYFVNEPLQSGLGLSRDRGKEFFAIKQRIAQIRDPSLRFQPQTKVIAFNGESNNAQITGSSKQAFSTSSSSQASFVQEPSGGKKTVGKGVNQYNRMVDEIGHGKNELPPLWVDIQESIDEKILDVEEKFEKLKTLRGLRFKPKFNEDEDQRLDAQINELVSELMTTIKICEKDLKDMMRQDYENESDQQIRKNIQQSFFIKLQDVTKQLRQMEREHLLKMKNLWGEEGEIFLNKIEEERNEQYRDMFSKDMEQKDKYRQDLIQLNHIDDQQKQRSDQIDRVIKQINDLAVLFKDLSMLVIEQGTILDRIDYNVKEAKINIVKGTVELNKTLKREKSSRAQGCIACLVSSIVICLTLLMLKHM